MDTENSKTSEPHRLNLKNPNKNMALANLSIYYTWKTSSRNRKTIHLKFQHQLGTILLFYLVVLTQFLTFKIFLNLSPKNMKV